MTPGARLGAIQELLEAIDADPRPADVVAGAFLRPKRYIGAKDRREISDKVWGILRRRARLDWWLEKSGRKADARGRLIADLALTDGLDARTIAPLFASLPHGPGELSSVEWKLADTLPRGRLFHHDMPDWVHSEYPAWLEPRLKDALGPDIAAELGAMRDEAPLDLRVNLLKTDREAARAALAAEGVATEPTPLSPIGLRTVARAALSGKAAFRDGLVEVQDEGSQILALLVDARPGQAVMDYCAGAGGKTLALAAGMKNSGRLIACDVSQSRADRAAERLRRAGVHNVTRRLLGQDSDKWLKRQAGGFDRVLVDAPCSGSGTWRRNPDAKWRLTPDGLAELAALQGRILDAAARLVKPGGRLVYATCSLLKEEDEDRVRAFLAGHADFSVQDVSETWRETVGGDCPCPPPFLRLTPSRNNTDGFFAAIFERRI